jgi:ABC-type sugar transport system ATPase subunit
MAGIVIQGLSKVYGDGVSGGGAKALDSLDLEVGAGELLVVVGPSGSGKTTLLRLVAGLDRPTAGTIRLADRNLADVPPQRRDVALVFQSLALYGHLTVEQNLAFALNANTIGGWFRRSAASDEAKARISQTAKLLRIEHLLGRRPAELSGGEQQRVALGRAIVREPKALLLDEPLSSLDLPTRRGLRRELKDLQRRLSVPTIYVTHDQAEALALGDRIAVLDRGHLVQVGTPKEIYERPKTRFVAEFFGPQGMNWIEGALLEKLIDRLKLSPPQGAVAGIRPEHLGMTVADQSGGCSGQVLAVENLGESIYVQVQLENTSNQLTLRLRNPMTSLPSPGNGIGIQIDQEQLHWFDAATGRRLET